MPLAQANGININYQITGSGEPLVLIAGLGYSQWMWHKMVPHLARHFEVITFDNRGAGQTDKPDGPYNVQMMADDTAGLLTALKTTPAHMMGHSMGGFIAQAIALTYPQQLNKLILSATNFGGPNHIPVTKQAMNAMTDRSGDPLAVIKRGIAVACAPDFAENHPQTVDQLVTYRLSDPVPPAQYKAQLAVGLGLLDKAASFELKLGGVQASTLILFGEHDAVVPPGNADLLAQAIPDSTVKILANAGHLFPIETPETAAEAVAEFLAG